MRSVGKLQKRPIRLAATFVNAVTVQNRYGDLRGGHGLTALHALWCPATMPMRSTQTIEAGRGIRGLKL